MNAQQAIPWEAVQPPEAPKPVHERHRGNRDAHICPCDSCDLAWRCSSRQLACDEFEAWLSGDKWASGERQPTRAIYRRTLNA